MREHDAGLAARARVAVGSVRGHLLVPRRHKADAAPAQRIEQRDYRVAAQPEDDLDADSLEVLGELIRRDA
jgi:hypothetical protein